MIVSAHKFAIYQQNILDCLSSNKYKYISLFRKHIKYFHLSVRVQRSLSFPHLISREMKNKRVFSNSFIR
jgi:hypothetical protein